MSFLEFMPLYIPCNMSFSSDYFYYHINSKYSKEIMNDPVARYQQSVREKKFLREKYPKYFGSNESDPFPSLGIGVSTIPKCWGCKINYIDHMNPTAEALIGKDESPLSLKVPNLDDTMQWLFEEIDTFEDLGFNKNQISLPDLQGPLNLSMKLVGDNRILSLIARKNKEDEVRHILDVATTVYIDIKKRLYKATNRPEKSNWSVSGCTYYYLSPSQWEKYIIPVIKRCQENLGDGVRLHHCGNADAKMMQSYSKIMWNDLEFGFGSDLKFARKTFKNPKIGPMNISCRISPFRMLNQTADQIAKDVEWITSQVQGGPASISVVGCPYGAPEENIHALWDAVDAYNKKKEEEEEEG